ncbi:Stig1 domain containing protein [Pyrenophora teres f. maculata]|nr:Stig1 domain containing protein [Pyrenophora teres f. maculata]
MQLVVALPEPHCRSNPQPELHAGDAQTPFIHSFPNAHALLQRPQLSTSFLVSWQVPSLQSSTPGPKQRVGPDVGLVVPVVDVIADVVLIADLTADEDDIVVFAEDCAVQLAKAPESVQVGVPPLDDDELLQIGVVGILLLKLSVLLAVIVGILPLVVFAPENVLLTADGTLLIVVFNHPENVLLAEADGILLLVVFNHPENVLLAEAVSTLLLVVFEPANVLLAEATGTLLLVVFSHPEKVLLTGAVGAALLVVLKKPVEVLLGLAEDAVSTEELVTVMENEEFIVLLVPGLSSELVGKLLVTAEELSEVIDGVPGSLGELTGVEALVGSAKDVEDISVLGKDVAGLDNELFVPLEDVELETTSLDTLLASEEDWAVFADVEALSDDDGEATGQKVPVVAIVVSVVIAVAVTVYRNQISLLSN